MTGLKHIKIAAVAPPFSGHLYPLLGLLQPFLKNADYSIRVYTGLAKKEMVTASGFSCQVIHTEDPYVFERIANTEKKISVLGMLKQFSQYLAILDELSAELEDAFSDYQPDMVIADFTAAPIALLYQKMSFKWITVIPTPFAIESSSGTPSYLGGLSPKNNLWGTLRDCSGRQFIHLFKRAAALLYHRRLASYRFKIYNKQGLENLYSPESIVAVGMKEFEFRDDFPPQLKWAGPAYLKRPSYPAEKTWNQPFAKRILVTNGTHLLWGKKEMLAITADLASRHPQIQFLVSLGQEESAAAEKKLADNILISPYLDYEMILPQVDAVIHHAGAGITYACIRHCKPALAIPYDYDQPDYAARLAWFGAGRRLKRSASLETIDQEFTALLETADWPALKELCHAAQTYTPADTVEKEINRLLGEI
ncbi:glycosyltransferase [Streptococcus chenjunshii]|nr:nucleotide disphospho-sugar-binding domain-containing protein [Streptococcus chenjunshii]